jgi:hypothetical protein
VVDLVIESEADSEEVEILEAPHILVVDLGDCTSLTLLQGEVVPMDTSKDSEGEMEQLKELNGVNLSSEEFRESARARGKRVLA